MRRNNKSYRIITTWYYNYENAPRISNWMVLNHSGTEVRALDKTASVYLFRGNSTICLSMEIYFPFKAYDESYFYSLFCNAIK